MVATVLLLALVAIASVTDLLWHKIYNWTTYSGIVAAFGSSAGGWALLATGRVTKKGSGGLAGLDFAPGVPARVCWLCGSVMVLCFVLFQDRRRRCQTDRHARGTAGTGEGDRSHALDVRAGCLPGADCADLAGRPLATDRPASCGSVVWTLRLGCLDPLSEAERRTPAAVVSGARVPWPRWPSCASGW